MDPWNIVGALAFVGSFFFLWRAFQIGRACVRAYKEGRGEKPNDQR